MSSSSPRPGLRALVAHPRTRRIVLWSLGSLLGLALAAAAAFGIAVALVSRQLPDVSSLANYQPKLPLRVYTAEGTLIGEFGEERRQLVPIDQMPRVLKDAVLAAEDARFYQHGGLDTKGLLRAIVANLTQDGRPQGASTITQQVARNMFLTSERTYTRKFNELLLAWRLEERLTKDQILEIYLNQIYLGNRAYGFAAAAQTYFGKPVQELSAAEAAMLAGLPKAPGANNPVNNLRRAVARQQYVIARMQETGYLSAEAAEAARAEPLKLRDPREQQAVHAEFVAEMVRQQMVERYGESAYTRGLKVYTAISDADQAAAYEALRQGVMDYELRQPWRAPEDQVELPPAGDPALDAAVDDALSAHPDNGDLLAVVVLEASRTKVRAARANGEVIEISGNGLRLAGPALAAKSIAPERRIRRGAVIRVMQTRGKTPAWAIAQLPEVEGAVVAMDPRDGTVRALVGGFDFDKNKFNHATQAWRQPGSAFKPFIYSAALEKGFMPATIVNDSPLYYDAGATGGQPWEPKNYDGTFAGPMTLRSGLARSKNMVTIRVLDHIGTQYAQEWLARFGFEADKHPAYLPMALGAGAVTPLQMASAYGVFANGGWKLPPLLITRITDHRDEVIESWSPPRLDQLPRAIPERNAFVMDTLLASVVKSGTGRSAYNALRRDDLYGKTGTTNDSHDAWFAGFGGQRVAVVWMGYDTPRQLGVRGESGGSLSLPVWTRYMREAVKGVPVARLKKPEGVTDIGGEWAYNEYAYGGGVEQLGVEEPPFDPNDPNNLNALPGEYGAAGGIPNDMDPFPNGPGVPRPPPSSPERNRILDIFR